MRCDAKQYRGQVCPWVRLSQTAKDAEVGASCMVRPRRRNPWPSRLHIDCQVRSAANTLGTMAWLSRMISQGVYTGS